MKNLKKLISVIVAVIMLVGSLATVSAADYADVESTNSYYKAIQVLSGLGIVTGDDEGNFNPKSDIKRSEMVALVCRAMGEEDVANGSATNMFTDVAANHWAGGYIAWGVNRGIINGMGDGTFAPDASVSYQDAVVMIMRALGYDRIAQRSENGGYPIGYLKLASQYGVLKDAGYDNTAAAPREVVAQLIFNGLTAAMVDVTEYGDTYEDDKYVIYNGKGGKALKNLLTDITEIYKVKLEVTATPKTDFAGCVDKFGNEMVKVALDDACDYYTISRIDTKIGLADGSYTGKFYIGETDLDEYLGHSFEAYIAEDDDLNGFVVLAAIPNEKEVVEETITVGLTDCAFTDNGTTAESVFAYFADKNDRKQTEIKVAKDYMYDSDGDGTNDATAQGFRLFYNGSEVVDANLATALGVTASPVDYTAIFRRADEIKFMGSKNAPYDKIFVTDYMYRRVKEVNVEEEFIKFTRLGALELDTEARNNDDFIYNLYDAEGNAITLEDIKADDILNIVCPIDYVSSAWQSGLIDDVDYLDIYVTSEAVTGKVDEILNTGEVVINGEAYVNATSGSGAIRVSDEGTFYITIDGKIVEKEASAVISKKFAFLMGVDSETKFSKATYTVKFFTAEGEVVTATVADILTVYDMSASWYNATTNPDGKATFRAENATAGFALADAFAAGTSSAAGDGGIYWEAADDETTLAAATAKIQNRFFAYKTNSNGELTEMRFATNVSNDEIERVAAPNGQYDADFGEFAGESVDNTILLQAFASGSASTYNVAKDNVAIASFDVLDETNNYDAFLYTFQGETAPAIALFTEEATPGLKYVPFAVVKAVGSALDADSNTVQSLTVVQSGEEFSVKVDYDKYPSGIAAAVGDVIQFAVNGEGEINKAEVIYDASAQALTAYATGKNVASYKAGYVFGLVTEFEDKLVIADNVFVNADGEIEGTAGQTSQFKVNETEKATYAWYEEALGVRNSVKAISITGVKATRKANAAYAAVARINGKASANRVEDIVMIALNPASVNTVAHINAIDFDITADGTAN